MTSIGGVELAGMTKTLTLVVMFNGPLFRIFTVRLVAALVALYQKLRV